ncbi:hypothetical protein O3P69_004474 [Scylla paramamosain]|uniref:Ankyrin repeat protein n=1 Tax=Scylla paramamosain TaxID=85552 RepID=A0AAW0UD34_SCYPA
MYAARENKPVFIDRLSELGCNPNDKNKEGFAAVHLAAMYSREETIRHLVQRKADINATGGPHLQTTIHMVCERANTAHRFMGRGTLVQRSSNVSGDDKRASNTTLNDPREQTAAHLVANRSTGAAVALIKTVLMHAKQDLRLTKDNGNIHPHATTLEVLVTLTTPRPTYDEGKLPTTPLDRPPAMLLEWARSSGASRYPTARQRVWKTTGVKSSDTTKKDTVLTFRMSQILLHTSAAQAEATKTSREPQESAKSPATRQVLACLAS